jgi:predicted hotdog family 3-hydroxylacyl-ACP dehydratase
MVDYTKVPIESLVPHSPPMVLIDEILHYDIEGLVALVKIYTDSLFYDESIGGVPAWASIEYMAQAISAWAGINAQKKKEGIKLGFLLGTRKLKMPVKVLSVGQRFEIEIKQLLKDESGLAVFDCRIMQGAKIFVEARVNVFEVNDIEEIINNTKEEK